MIFWADEFVNRRVDAFGSCWAFVSLQARELTCPALLSIYRKIKSQNDVSIKSELQAASF